MPRWLTVTLFVVLLGIIVAFALRPDAEQTATGDAETRIVNYLKENVRPGQPVLVTDLYNNVFTAPDEREVLQRLHDEFFRIPAVAAQLYMKTGKIPTLQELSDHFQYRIPGEMDVMLRIMEADPRAPKFLERDPATGEITSIDVDRIAADERFGKLLQGR